MLISSHHTIIRNKNRKRLKPDFVPLLQSVSARGWIHCLVSSKLDMVIQVPLLIFHWCMTCLNMSMMSEIWDLPYLLCWTLCDLELCSPVKQDIAINYRVAEGSEDRFHYDGATIRRKRIWHLPCLHLCTVSDLEWWSPVNIIQHRKL
mgnify:CR=1 FL=1